MEHEIDKKANQIGKIIVEQMGGLRRLSILLGIKSISLLPKGVAFKWPNRQRGKGNMVEITLRPDDTYDMEFFNATKSAKKPVKKYSGIYNDQLVELFEKQTGWYLRMASNVADRFSEE